MEIGEFEKAEQVDKNYQPTSEEMVKLIKKRDAKGPIKDREKSRKTKEEWRKNRHKMMRGIKSFHRSTEGKRFHKRLGRFLASRITRKDEHEITEYLKGLSGAKSSLITETEFYHTMTEQEQVEDLALSYGIPLLNSIESKIIRNEELSETELDFLVNITEGVALIKSLSDKSGVPEGTIEKYWNEIKSALVRDGKKEDDERFYGLLVHILKKKLNM